ncbi:MAG: hypothetical protein IKH54_01335 [Bacilli bacterium]|nr:hypothetical protein [Bacilli bacterium]
MNKKFLLYIVGILIFMTGIFMCSCLYVNDIVHNNSIKSNFIAVFKGSTNNTINSTYIYKNTTGYKYINTVMAINSFSSTYNREIVVNKGEVKLKEEILEIIDMYNSSDYVVIKKDGKIMSIEEFSKKLIKD